LGEDAAMKRWGRVMIWAALAVGVLLVGVAVLVRLAPDNPAVWQVPVDTGAPLTGGPCAEAVTRLSPITGGQAACLLDGDPADVLAKLDAIALATPRTRRMAGTPETGLMTWETRSLLFAFPDFTTAQVTAQDGKTRLDIVARQRFGSGDAGVNAARLKDWLAKL
jgi:Protein of unknown function (DUF1499)